MRKKNKISDKRGRTRIYNMGNDIQNLNHKSLLGESIIITIKRDIYNKNTNLKEIRTKKRLNYCNDFWGFSKRVDRS